MAVNFAECASRGARVTALGLALRWVHLASSIALVGGAVILLLAGPSDRPTACAWQREVARADFPCDAVTGRRAGPPDVGRLRDEVVLVGMRVA